MPNTATYKDWLFVKVPEDADWFEFNDPKEGEIVYQNNGNDDMILKIPPGSWQIIGKGDQLTESDWEGIMETFKSSWGTQYYPEFPLEKIKWSRRTKPGFDKATPSGLSLLHSLDMEPGTTLVLKKNDV